MSAAAVGAYIGAAHWFTSSTSFANPAVTIGRILSDTLRRHRARLGAGIRRRATRRWPDRLGLLALYPDADNVVVPHDTPTAPPANTDPRRP